MEKGFWGVRTAWRWADSAWPLWGWNIFFTPPFLQLQNWAPAPPPRPPLESSTVKHELVIINLKEILMILPVIPVFWILYLGKQRPRGRKKLVWGLLVDEELSQISEFLTHLCLHFLGLHCNVNHFSFHPPGAGFRFALFFFWVRIEKGFLPNSLCYRKIIITTIPYQTFTMCQAQF